MTPMPSHKHHLPKPAGGTIPSLPTALVPSTGSYSTHNRRVSSCPVQRMYPWLLAASTCVAAAFCLLYITKPVILPAPHSPDLQSHTNIRSALAAAPSSAPSGASSLLPTSDSLPGDASQPVKPSPANPRSALVGKRTSSPTEETNIRIQHILTAEAPGGHLDRIDIEVPVLYQSRNLRWDAADVEQARSLLLKLMDYQEKSQSLRAEGAELLDAWNALVQKSIPASDLRADSPSLPANQQDAADAPLPSTLISTEAIELEPSGK